MNVNVLWYIMDIFINKCYPRSVSFECHRNPIKSKSRFSSHYHCSFIHSKLCQLATRLLPHSCTGSGSNLRKAKHKEARLPESLKHPKDHANKPIP